MFTTRVAALMLALSAVPAIAAGTAASPSTAPQDCAKPEYPLRWQHDGDSGSVVLAYQLGAHGKVIQSKVIESSGDARIDRASVRALERCTFAPTQAAQVWSKVRYSWIVE